jgi:hypothetical protein
VCEWVMHVCVAYQPFSISHHIIDGNDHNNNDDKLTIMMITMKQDYKCQCKFIDQN